MQFPGYQVHKPPHAPSAGECQRGAGSHHLSLCLPQSCDHNRQGFFRGVPLLFYVSVNYQNALWISGWYLGHTLLLNIHLPELPSQVFWGTRWLFPACFCTRRRRGGRRCLLWDREWARPPQPLWKRPCLVAMLLLFSTLTPRGQESPRSRIQTPARLRPAVGQEMSPGVPEGRPDLCTWMMCLWGLNSI